LLDFASNENDENNHIKCDQLFKEGVKYSVVLEGGVDPEEIDGEFIEWGAGLPLRMAKMFAAQIFAGADRDAQGDQQFAKNLVAPAPMEGGVRAPMNRANSSLTKEPRLDCAELIDILSPDLCCFETLTSYVTEKTKRLAKERATRDSLFMAQTLTLEGKSAHGPSVNGPSAGESNTQ
jgi:hypothetical protein